MLRSKFATLMLASIAVLFALAIITHPKESLEASIRGLDTWWRIVFPSLLPFFIVAELLISFGVVRFIGVLLEPIMRPVFRVPGVGGFVWAMGMASGNPAGAKLTVRMRQENQVSKIEGERLVSFTTSANPLFIFGAVSVGFFQNAALGIIFSIAHYVGNILVGLVMRFYGRNEDIREEKINFSLKEAFRAMHRTRLMNKKPFGQLLGDAVSSSVRTLLMIGGFIILFSVLNRLLSIMNISDLLAILFNIIFSVLTIPESLSIPFISGLFEMTIGSQMVSETSHVLLLQQAIVVSFLLGFGGFSTQAQAASIMAQTDIRYAPFFFARILHGLFASFITLLIWRPIYEERLDVYNSESILPVFTFINENTFIDFLQHTIAIGPLITIITLWIYTIIYARRVILRFK